MGQTKKATLRASLFNESLIFRLGNEAVLEDVIATILGTLLAVYLVSISQRPRYFDRKPDYRVLVNRQLRDWHLRGDDRAFR